MIRNAGRILNSFRKLKEVPGFSNFLTELKIESRRALELKKLLPIENTENFLSSVMICSEIRNDIEKEEGWWKFEIKNFILYFSKNTTGDHFNTP